MRLFLVLIFIYSSLVADDRLFDCTEVFKQRKSELLIELERIDEQKQSLSALKTATEALLKKKELNFSQKEEEINNKLATITKKESNVKKMLKTNQDVLAEIKKTKMDKIAQTFAKMKAASAGAILADMKPKDAVKILQSLKPKVVGKILSKISPIKASKLTLLLGN